MRVCLVQCNYQEVRATRGGTLGVNPPIGLAYIAAVLEKNGHQVLIVDANAAGDDETGVAMEVFGFDPEIVGISILTPAHNWAVKLAKEIRNYCDVTFIVAGGPHATAIPERLLREGFDAVVRGEGEYTMLELAQNKDWPDILGLSYLDEWKQMVSTPDRPFTTDVDAIPFPARHLLVKNGVDRPYASTGTRYYPWSPVLTSRGCPFKCYFCNKNVFGVGFHPRSPQNVFDEIYHLAKDYGVREIDIYDDCWNVDIKRAEAILDLIIASGLKLHIRCSNGVRVNWVTEQFLRKFKRAGGRYIAFGIESGDQAVLDRIPKSIKLEEVRRAVAIARKVGLEITGFFILGLLGDTPQTMQKTIDFAKSLDLDVALFNVLAPYPGTRLYDEVLSHGKILITDYSNLHHSLGRGLFLHPDAPAPDAVGEAYRGSFRQFYMRPSFVAKQLLRIRSWGQVKAIGGGAVSILKTIGSKRDG